MREGLAERLLAKVMDWSPADVARERPILQSLASYKYDAYQQFSTGMHFIESLATWMRNFEKEERDAAYEFVTDRLLFVSESEMRHLVGLSYQDSIKDVLIGKVAMANQLPSYFVTRILNSREFKIARRRSLFLGLSDGARVDILRRMASLSNEQVHGTYQISDEKAEDMQRELSQNLKDLDSPENGFNSLFLMDDFAGSGDSLVRMEKGALKGKVVKCIQTLIDANENTRLLDLNSLSIFVVLYICTERALRALEKRLMEDTWQSSYPKCTVLPTYVLDDSIKVTRESAPEFEQLLNNYYDESIMDKHLLTGGPDVIHGYANCSLPLVLAHNTPNNSVYLLWADKPGLKTKPLFPRVSRHRE